MPHTHTRTTSHIPNHQTHHISPQQPPKHHIPHPYPHHAPPFQPYQTYPISTPIPYRSAATTAGPYTTPLPAQHPTIPTIATRPTPVPAPYPTRTTTTKPLPTPSPTPPTYPTLKRPISHIALHPSNNITTNIPDFRLQPAPAPASLPKQRSDYQRNRRFLQSLLGGLWRQPRGWEDRQDQASYRYRRLRVVHRIARPASYYQGSGHKLGRPLGSVCPPRFSVSNISSLHTCVTLYGRGFRPIPHGLGD